MIKGVTVALRNGCLQRLLVSTLKFCQYSIQSVKGREKTEDPIQACSEI